MNINSVGMSPKICIASCVANGNEFAIVRNNLCFCSDLAPTDAQGSDSCNTVCPLLPVNSNLFCGGLGLGRLAAMSVFRRAIMSLPLAPLPPIPLPAIPEPTGWRYSGCFFGDAWILGAGYSLHFPSPRDISAEICSLTCSTGGRSYTYAGLHKRVCYCSNFAPLAGLQAGLGHCTSEACAGYPGESCGGLSNYAPYLANTKSIMITIYVRAPPVVTTAVRVFDAAMSQGWSYWGCYYGALYLLDTILTGTQTTSLIDPTPYMSADKCIAQCLGYNSNPAYKFALTLGGACFCSTKTPTDDLLSGSQLMCNEPCPSNAGERCGGFDPLRPSTLGGALINIYGRTVKVSGFRFVLRTGGGEAV